jgi:hypothetical protein
MKATTNPPPKSLKQKFEDNAIVFVCLVGIGAFGAGWAARSNFPPLVATDNTPWYVQAEKSGWIAKTACPIPPTSTVDSSMSGTNNRRSSGSATVKGNGNAVATGDGNTLSLGPEAAIKKKAKDE